MAKDVKVLGSIPSEKLQTLVDLGKKKPTNFYIVNRKGPGTEDGVFRLRLVDEDSTLNNHFIVYKTREGKRKTLNLSMIRHDHYHFFTNYWLAWAFAQRVRKGKSK